MVDCAQFPRYRLLKYLDYSYHTTHECCVRYLVKDHRIEILSSKQVYRNGTMRVKIVITTFLQMFLKFALETSIPFSVFLIVCYTRAQGYLSHSYHVSTFSLSKWKLSHVNH